MALGLALFLYACKSYMGLFFLGACFAVLRQRGLLVWRSRWGARALALALVGWTAWSCAHSPDIGNDSEWRHAVRAAALVTAVHLSPDLMRWMSSRLSRLLGELSFALYLVHYVLLVTLTSHAVLWLDRRGRLDEAHAMGVFALTVVSSLLAAWVFTRVEVPLLRWVHARTEAWRLPERAAV